MVNKIDLNEMSTGIINILLGSRTELDLYRRYLNDDELFLLFRILKNNSSLLKLSVGKNSILIESFKCLCDSLAKNKKLLELDLQDCNISDEYIDHLISSLNKNERLTELDLSYNYISLDKLKEFIVETQSKYLRYLILYGVLNTEEIKELSEFNNNKFKIAML